MSDDTGPLSGREKEVLRLMAAGHTAKSAAIELDLSVHTVNDYLREARRKLGVGSSREAARVLAAEEKAIPEKIGHRQIGIGSAATDGQNDGSSVASDRKGWSRRWIAGVIAMITIVAALALFATSADSDRPPVASVPAAAAISAQDQQAASIARGWVELLDRGQWQQSWQQSGSVFRSAVTADAWTTQAGPVRTPLGKVLARSVKSVQATSDLPGAPAGEYRVVEFGSDFAGMKGLTETVIMVREAGSWKVVGYFVK